jgi:hypothetical protein
MKKTILIIAFLCFYGLSLSAQSFEEIKKDCKSKLNEFCELYYDDCFGGREYISKSLTVTDVKYEDENTVIVTGKHRYLNYINISMTTSYLAYIYISKNRSYMKITFKKQSKDPLGDTYWEECTRDSDDD